MRLKRAKNAVNADPWGFSLRHGTTTLTWVKGGWVRYEKLTFLERCDAWRTEDASPGVG
jgi:hypothetical protein